MSHNHPDKKDQPIHCISCRKVIGQGFIIEGSIQLLCKCGTKTTIAAQPKKKPEGQQAVMVRIDTNANAKRDIGMGRASFF